MSREELSGPTAAAVPGASSASANKHWVGFAFGEKAVVHDDRDAADRYWLQKVSVVRGRPPEGLTLGCKVIRRETEGARPPAAIEHQLEGSLEARLSTRPSEEARLQASWQREPWRVALLLTFSHLPTFWALPKDERAATFLRLPDTSAGASDPLMKRLVHRLYRARSRPGDALDWDYLAYFEMLPRDVAHLRERLEELRQARRNPLWAQVTRETELWLSKETRPPMKST